jgi:iron complex outermembrane receptor protein
MQVMKQAGAASISARALVVVLGAWSAGAVAQSSGAPPSGQLAEIVVTAEKRAESIQNVPVAITAFSGERLEAMGAKSFLDYALEAPSISFGFSGVEGRATRDQISIRGVSGGNTTATYVNETLVPTGLGLRLVDIDRVEVLRGPQGTLYGSGAMGGLVKLVTRRPDASAFGGSASVSTGKTSGAADGDYAADVTLNVPVVPGVGALRLSSYFTQEAGFIDRAFGQPLAYAPEINTAPLAKGVHRDVNRQRVYGTRLSGLFAWGDDGHRWEVTPVFQYQRREEAGATDADSSAATRGLQVRSFDIAEPLGETARIAQLTVRYAAQRFEVVSSTSWWQRRMREAEDDTESFDEQLRADFNDRTAPPFPSVIRNDWTQKSVQQELRVSGDVGPVRWLVGGYYQKGDSLRKIRWSMPGWSAQPRYFSPGLGDDIFNCDCGGDSRERALFGSVTYAVRPNLNLSAGLRHFRYESTGAGLETGIFASNVPFRNQFEESGDTPRFALDYRLSDQVLLFASAAEGFRNGSGQSPLPPQCLAEAAALGVGSASFRSDRTWNYEAGVKTTLHNRATVNASVFDVEWTDLQQTVRLPSCGFSRTGNVGKARIRGVELEATVVPMPGLELGASLGWMKPEIVDPGVGTRSRAGDRPLNVAKVNGSANASYEFPVNATLAGFARLDYQYLGDSFTTFNQDEPVRVTRTQPYRRRPAYQMINARLGVRVADGWQIALYGENLTDEVANFGEIAPIGIDRSNRPRYVTNRPRNVGIEVKVDF